MCVHIRTDLCHHFRSTGETSWTPPGESTSESAAESTSHGWRQAYDEASQTSYYYNVRTGETSWTLPESEQEEDLSYLVFAVVRLQCMFRGTRDRRRAARLVKAQYQMTKDPVADRTLYTNLVTNTSAWAKPALFTTLGVGDDADDDDDDDDAFNFEDFRVEAERDADGEDDGDEENPASSEDGEAGSNKKHRRQQPRSKAQQRVDAVEDAGTEGVELDFSGLNAWKLSSRIWNLQHLKTLVLSKNQLKRIPSGIQDLVHLEELDVSYNHLTRLPSCLQTTTTLTALNASNNRIQTFSPKLWKLRAMRVLNLSHNLLQELSYVEGDLKLLRETREWQVGVGLLTNLISLTVSHNNLTALPKSVEKCTSLQYLNLSHNNIRELGEELGALQALKQLYLRKNALATLPDSIGNLARLEILELAQNRLATVPPSTGNLQTLQQMVLSQNQLKHLPEELGALSQLNLLAMDENPSFITFDVFFRRLSGIRSFSATSCGIVRFETLEFLKDAPVQSLRLRQNAMSEFPVSFSRSIMKDTLQELVLDNNALTQFPMEVLRFCHRLVHLDVSMNNLRRIPVEIGELRHLEVLYLSRNALQELPDELALLSRLQAFKCDHNRLRSLPLGIGSLTALTHLDVSFNQLQTLPTSMMSLKALVSLYANDNALKQHPPALYYSTHYYCDYSNNPFSDDKNQTAFARRRQVFAEAMKRLDEKQFGVAEALFSTLLRDIDRRPHEEQKKQQPQIHFARGVCRFMLMKAARDDIDASSWTVNVSEREIHGAELVQARWRRNQQVRSTQEKQQRLQEQEQEQDGSNNNGAATARERTPQDLSPNSGFGSVANAPASKHPEIDKALVHSYSSAAAKRQVAREQQHEYATGTVHDLQTAIKHGVPELPTAHYLEGLAHMALMAFADAVTSFTDALKSIIPRSGDGHSENDNNYACSDGDAEYLLSQSVPKISIPIFLKRAEAYRRLGHLPAALADVRHVLTHHPMDTKAVEDAEQVYAHEWEVLQNEYFVDQETLFRAFDVAGRSGLARRPEVVDLHRCSASRDARTLRPAERFAAEISRIATGIQAKHASERTEIEGNYAAKQKLLARTRDFKREIRENLQLEMEETQQRAVEQEMARRAEVERLERSREANECVYMQYEDEWMHWFVAEELRLEMERLRLLENAQRQVDAQAAYATRLARRGGRRQQGGAAATQRGGGAGSSNTRGSTRDTPSPSPSSGSSAASTPATRRTPATQQRRP